MEGLEACETHSDGEACFLEGSLMATWVQDFWSAFLVDEIGPVEEIQEDAEARCTADAGFFGPYAGMSPIEDFAEAFSAFVFHLEPDSPEQQVRLDWFAARPGLAEYRDRADEAGLTPLANTFDYCGR